MDPNRRGEYQGVEEVSRALGSQWAPWLYTGLAMSWFSGGAGWLVIAGIIVVATLGLGPSVRLAERFRDAHFPPVEEGTGPGEGEVEVGVAPETA
jgi:hypothetical protein